MQKGKEEEKVVVQLDEQKLRKQNNIKWNNRKVETDFKRQTHCVWPSYGIQPQKR